MVTLSPRNTIIVAVLLSAVVGSVTGLGASYIAHTSPTAQTRNFYLFAVDQSFNSSVATGLKADYDFSANVITVNKGDTLVIHFYNPTDEAHTFTMSSPYTSDVVLPAITINLISSANITITATQAGIFHYYCRFHAPSMSGNLVVQG